MELLHKRPLSTIDEPKWNIQKAQFSWVCATSKTVALLFVICIAFIWFAGNAKQCKTVWKMRIRNPQPSSFQDNSTALPRIATAKTPLPLSTPTSHPTGLPNATAELPHFDITLGLTKGFRRKKVSSNSLPNAELRRTKPYGKYAKSKLPFGIQILYCKYLKLLYVNLELKQI